MGGTLFWALGGLSFSTKVSTASDISIPCIVFLRLDFFTSVHLHFSFVPFFLSVHLLLYFGVSCVFFGLPVLLFTHIIIFHMFHYNFSYAALLIPEV